MLTRRGVDAGPILMQEKMAILPEETAGELSERMACVGARLLCKTLAAMEKGMLTPVEQDPEQATQCPMLAKEHGRNPLVGFCRGHCQPGARRQSPGPGRLLLL